MTQKNPYEIRHDLLNEARGMLHDQWQAEVDRVIHNASSGSGENTEKIPKKDMPAYPSIEEILELAAKMEAFVNTGSSPTKAK